MHTWLKRFGTAAALSAIALLGCGETTEVEEAGAFTCHVDRGFPYPSGIPYVGIHGGPGNNDWVPCATAGRFESAWHMLAGAAVAQPNSFSPDGQTTYVTTSQPAAGDCNVWALDAATGSVQWCKTYDDGTLWSTVEVDLNGHLFFTTGAAIVSLDASGAERWVTATPEGGDAERSNGAIGLHFTPDGHLATVTDQGDVLLIAREDGRVLSALDLPEAYGFFPGELISGGIDVATLLPTQVVDDFRRLQHGSLKTLLAVFAGAGNFSDNTVGIAPDGTIYVIGRGETRDDGALIQVRVNGTADAPVLTPGWYMPTHRGSASSPAISPDGRYVKVADGNADLAFLSPRDAEASLKLADIAACDANTDSNPDATVCGEAYKVPLVTGPTMGTSPMLADGFHFQYEVQVSDLLNTEDADIRAYKNDELLWERALPDDLQWTSVITVTENHLIGTGSRFTDSGESLVTVELPATAESELIILARETGDVVFRAPVTDDSTSTVTVGPDGAVYVTMLGLLHMLSIETQATGGIIRFAPRAED